MSMQDRTGITVVHRDKCKSSDGTRCNCSPGYRAEAYDHVARKRKYKTLPTLKAAQAWRQDMQVAIRSGGPRVLEVVTLADVYEDWSNAAGKGVAKGRGGKPYKPSVLRAYAGSWDTQLKSELGRAKVGEVDLHHVQAVVDKMVEAGFAAQTIRNAITALRVLFKWAIRTRKAVVNPCVGVELPAGGTTRDNIVPPATALGMIQELTSAYDRALWAVAFFAGLRRGELMGLRWEDVSLVDQTISVAQAWDPGAAEMVAPKSKAGTRVLGFPGVLVPFLAYLDGTEGLVFARPDGRPFLDTTIMHRAEKAWSAAMLPRLTLHECRHTYASVMIAAGVNIKTIQEWMGHSSVTITLDLYGHLLPGAAAEALGLLDAYLARELS